MPTRLYLAQNYPNPFNAATSISYEVPTSGRVLLEVSGLLDDRVATLVDDRHRAGESSILWDASRIAFGL